MRYLMRDGAPLTDGQWEQIDKAVVEEATNILTGRRFLTLKAVSAQTQNVPVDKMENVAKAQTDYWARGDSDAIEIASRRFLEIMTVYSDFSISWRDIENDQGAGVQAARDAAALCARREDELIFHGDAKLGVEGVFSARGINKVPISDWSKGENPTLDVVKALEVLVDKGNTGARVLVVSTDLWGKLHRIQQGTGTMEVDRVRSLVGKLFYSSRLDKNTAALVYCDPQNIDLVVGQDMITAYMGNEKMDHVFRVMETVVPRVKRPTAIAVLS